MHTDYSILHCAQCVIQARHSPAFIFGASVQTHQTTIHDQRKASPMVDTAWPLSLVSIQSASLADHLALAEVENTSRLASRRLCLEVEQPTILRKSEPALLPGTHYTMSYTETKQLDHARTKWTTNLQKQTALFRMPFLKLRIRILLKGVSVLNSSDNISRSGSAASFLRHCGKQRRRPLLELLRL